MNDTLNHGEPHPAVSSAMRWIRALTVEELAMWQESLSSSAIEGNRTAEICSETLHRLIAGQPVSDRYLLGLAWTLSKLVEGVVE